MLGDIAKLLIEKHIIIMMICFVISNFAMPHNICFLLLLCLCLLGGIAKLLITNQIITLMIICFCYQQFSNATQ